MWYRFRQNNSFGVFTIDQDVAIEVWIEAPNAEMANDRAEAIGIYFGGCDSGVDCSCCGDRWYPIDRDDEAEEYPLAGEGGYGTNEEYHEVQVGGPDFRIRGRNWSGSEPYMYVYHEDGTKWAIYHADAEVAS